MKRLIILIALCFSINSFAQNLSPDVQDFKNYVDSNRLMAEQGKLNWSIYYKGLYSRMANLNAPIDMLERTNMLIRDAELYESGKIDLSEFEYRRRSAQVQQASADQSRQNSARTDAIIAQQQSEERERQRSSNIMAIASQFLQSSAPRTLAPAPTLPQSGGMMGFLQSQSVNGLLRYCRYSNGVVNTVNAVELCPMNVQ